MQFTLLSICITWKLRQRRLHIDDFGTPIHPESQSSSHAPYRDAEEGQQALEREEEDEEEEPVPGLVIDPEEDAGAVRKALESALGEAVAGDVRDGAAVLTEEMPLLDASVSTQGQVGAQGQTGKGKGRAGWW